MKGSPNFELSTVHIKALINRARAARFRVGGGEGGGLERQTSKDESHGGGGGAGICSPEIFDFNSSQMPRNAFKINQRNT